MTDSEQSARPLRPQVTCVVAVGVLLSLCGAAQAWLSASPVTALGVVAGSTAAVLHLLAVAYWVRWAMTGNGITPLWLLFTLVKLGVLFGGLGWLVHGQLLPILPFLCGYLALPLGIVLAEVDWGGLIGSSASSQTKLRMR